jgi:hypothetical protein
MRLESIIVHAPSLHIILRPSTYLLILCCSVLHALTCRGNAAAGVARDAGPCLGYLFSFVANLVEGFFIPPTTLNDEILVDKSVDLLIICEVSLHAVHYIPLFLAFVLHSLHYSYKWKYSRPVSSEHVKLLLSDG